MTTKPTLHHLTPSPNNIKARIALAYKDIAHDEELVDRDDRSRLIELSGQPLSPVLEHGGRVVFDSCAILRYLDANFEQGPRLFSSDRDEMKQIEQWERFHWNEIGAALGPAFGVLFSGADKPHLMARLSALLNENTANLESALADRPWLVGERMTAADILVASFVTFGCFSESLAGANPVWGWFREHVDLGEGRERTRDHASRVTAYLTEASV